MSSLMRQMVSVSEQDSEKCLFCSVTEQRDRKILVENRGFIAVFDNYPVNRGHTLVISKRHVSTPFEMDSNEGVELIKILQATKSELDRRFHPDGYNLGVNSGVAAGQTVPHLHIHLIPRYRGDVKNPRGGIRNFKKALVPY